MESESTFASPAAESSAPASMAIPAIVEDPWEVLPDEEWFRRLDEAIAQAEVLHLPELPQSRAPEIYEDGLDVYTRPATQGVIEKKDILQLQYALAGEAREDIRGLLGTFGLVYWRTYYDIGVGDIGEALETEVREFLNGDVITLQCGDNWAWDVVELVFVRQAGDTYRFAAILPKSWKYGRPEVASRAFLLGGMLFYETEGSNTGGTGSLQTSGMIVCLEEGRYETLCYYPELLDDDRCMQLTPQGEKTLEDGRIVFTFQASESYHGYSLCYDKDILEKYTAVNYMFHAYYEDGYYTIRYDDAPISEERMKRFPILVQTKDLATRKTVEELLYAENIRLEGCAHLLQQAYRDKIMALAQALVYQPIVASEKIYLEKVDTTPEVAGILSAEELEQFISTLDSFHMEEGNEAPLLPILTANGLSCSGKEFFLRSDRAERRLDDVTFDEGVSAPLRVITIYQFAGHYPYYLQLFFMREQDDWRISGILERNGVYSPGGYSGSQMALVEVGGIPFYCYDYYPDGTREGIMLHPLKNNEAVNYAPDIADFFQERTFYSYFPSAPIGAGGGPLCTLEYGLYVQGATAKLPFALYNDWDGKGFYTYNADYQRLQEDGMQIPYLRDLMHEIILLSFQNGSPYIRGDALEEYQRFTEQYGQR